MQAALKYKTWLVLLRVASISGVSISYFKRWVKLLYSFIGCPCTASCTIIKSLSLGISYPEYLILVCLLTVEQILIFILQLRFYIGQQLSETDIETGGHRERNSETERLPPRQRLQQVDKDGQWKQKLRQRYRYTDKYWCSRGKYLQIAAFLLSEEFV